MSREQDAFELYTDLDCSEEALSSLHALAAATAAVLGGNKNDKPLLARLARAAVDFALSSGTACLPFLTAAAAPLAAKCAPEDVFP